MLALCWSVVLSTCAAQSDPADAPAPLEGIYSRAEVSGPRGTFVTELVSLADGRVRFSQTHPDRRTELLAIGDDAWSREGEAAFVPAEAGTAAFVHGHDVPRLAAARPGPPARLELARSTDRGGAGIVIELADWRRAIDRDLPHAATFVDERNGERFAYRYTHLLPFRLAPGCVLPDEPSALHARLGDLGALALAHERVMAAHRASDADALVAGGAEVTTVSGRGRLTTATRSQFLERMRGYLGSIRFTRYVDTAVPVVAVSADGTLGWLACEMAAAGTSTAPETSTEGAGEPIAYAFSWVELYARPLGGATGQGTGDWVAIGNASSERP